MSLCHSQAKSSHTNFVVGCNSGAKQENRDPVEVQKGGEVLELADSAEETTYIHPASKSRFGSQHKGLRPDQQQQQHQQQQQQQRVNGMTTLVYPYIYICSHCESCVLVNWLPHPRRLQSICLVRWSLMSPHRYSAKQ